MAALAQSIVDIPLMGGLVEEDISRAVPGASGQRPHQQAFNAFVDSCDPTCAAHSREIAQDVADISRIARALDSFLILACGRMEEMSYATKRPDLDQMRACVIEAVEDCFTPEAARLFNAEMEA